MNAWKNGEVSQALSRMRLVLDLDQKAPDVTSPDAAGAYQAFYDKIRVEHDTINSAYAEARRHLADRRFAQALQICQQFLEKYSGHALFQSLKFDVEEQQRQQLSAYIADVDRRLEQRARSRRQGQPRARSGYRVPGGGSLPAPGRGARGQANSRELDRRTGQGARSGGQIAEALGDLETLRTIHGSYPGLAFEKERLQKRLEQQTKDAARTRWVRQIDGQLGSRQLRPRRRTARHGAGRIRDDTELVELRAWLARAERTARADELVTEGQQLCAQGQFEQGVDLLKIALQLDDRTAVRQVLRDLFVTRAQESLNTDWRAVEAFADRALELDANHALARSLRAQKRACKEEIPQLASQAPGLQAAGDFAGALAEVEKGLAAYPGDARLSAIASTPAKS